MVLISLANATIESIFLVINSVKLLYYVGETVIYIPHSIYCYLTHEPISEEDKEKQNKEDMVEISRGDLRKLLSKVEMIEERDEKIEKMCQEIMKTKL